MCLPRYPILSIAVQKKLVFLRVQLEIFKKLFASPLKASLDFYLY